MNPEFIANMLDIHHKALVETLTATRPQEIIIIGLLVIAIGISAAVLINQRKARTELRQLRELLDQKEDKPNGESSETTTE